MREGVREEGEDECVCVWRKAMAGRGKRRIGGKGREDGGTEGGMKEGFNRECEIVRKSKE